GQMQHCDMLERVSQLIDGELTPEDDRLVREHLAVCAECRRAREDFLGTRELLRSCPPDPNLDATDRARRRLFGKPVVRASNAGVWRASAWRRKISVPLPVAAAFMAAMVVMSFVLFRSQMIAGHMRSKALEIIQPAEQPIEGKATNLARFDHGGRAVVYK